ncbi:hypothetical protein PR048_013915 [Dryococelus australis]|uniref:Uncharacterized protein n=1 Tax=Dryococelus australis TaxID=614101 RepID=A0ABQ9HTK6_9NEOP|nr:hypothetical protein PR048_013915 [Dryococelus australis]
MPVLVTLPSRTQRRTDGLPLLRWTLCIARVPETGIAHANSGFPIDMIAAIGRRLDACRQTARPHLWTSCWCSVTTTEASFAAFPAVVSGALGLPGRVCLEALKASLHFFATCLCYRNQASTRVAAVTLCSAVTELQLSKCMYSPPADFRCHSEVPSFSKSQTSILLKSRPWQTATHRTNLPRAPACLISAEVDRCGSIAAAASDLRRTLPLGRRAADPTEGEPGSIPGGVAHGYSHVGIVPDDAADRRVFSGVSRFPFHFIPTLLRTLASPSSALKRTLAQSPLPTVTADDQCKNGIGMFVHANAESTLQIIGYSSGCCRTQQRNGVTDWERFRNGGAFDCQTSKLGRHPRRHATFRSTRWEIKLTTRFQRHQHQRNSHLISPLFTCLLCVLALLQTCEVSGPRLGFRRKYLRLNQTKIMSATIHDGSTNLIEIPCCRQRVRLEYEQMNALECVALRFMPELDFDILRFACSFPLDIGRPSLCADNLLQKKVLEVAAIDLEAGVQTTPKVVKGTGEDMLRDGIDTVSLDRHMNKVLRPKAVLISHNAGYYTTCIQGLLPADASTRLEIRAQSGSVGGCYPPRSSPHLRQTCSRGPSRVGGGEIDSGDRASVTVPPPFLPEESTTFRGCARIFWELGPSAQRGI